ncbi:hypothetical protein FWD20_01165 [Candidatus Saccharibacteria bacterium]|nr:hypothetical protein [Candidatus Saccharibacteria bacterium]
MSKQSESSGKRLLPVGMVSDPFYYELDLEARCLSPMISGAKVVVVDEYYNTGRSVAAARYIANAAGAQCIASTNKHTHWYHQAEAAKVDVGKMTSPHAPFMREVGRSVARLVDGDPEYWSNLPELAAYDLGKKAWVS